MVIEMTKKIEWKKLLDLNFPRCGFIRGIKITDFIRDHLDDCSFSDLLRPLYITASDIENQEEVIFSKGNVTDAIRASISIPGIFNPIKINGRVLVDGGVFDQVPVEILRKKGADIIIAVNLHGSKPLKMIEESIEDIDLKAKLPNIYSIMLKTFELIEISNSNTRMRYLRPDIMITPDLKKIGYQDFHKSAKAISEGEKAANIKIDDIRKMISRNSLKNTIGWFKKR